MRPSSVRFFLAVALAFGATATLPAFQLRERKEKLLESGELTISILQCHNLDFSFLCPRGWVMVPDAGTETIVMETRDFAIRLVMQIRMGSAAVRFPIDPAELRKKVLEQVPNSIITEESQCYASNLPGQAFDLRQQTSETTTCCRVAFVPFPGGCTEFTLSAAPASWPTALAEFGGFLTSFNVAKSSTSASSSVAGSPPSKPQGVRGLNH